MQNIQILVDARDTETLKATLASAGEMEIIHALHELPIKDCGILFRLLPKNRALSVFEELDADQQELLLRSLTHEQAVEYLDALAPDQRVQLLDELPAKVAKRLLAEISPAEREMTNLLLGYAHETAGRIMTPEFISLDKTMTAEQALAKVRGEAAGKETIYTLFVTDTTKRLEGVISLRELLAAAPSATLADVMVSPAISVNTGDDQEKVARLLKDLDLLAMPVVDLEGRIVGIVTIDDALDIIEEETTEDIYDQAGLADITRKEQTRSEVLVSGSLWAIWKVRLPFLLLTVAAGLLAAWVMEGFEERLAEVVMVAFFIPLVMDMGGNVGTQSATVFTRGVVLGHIRIKEFFRYFAKEVGIGFSLGIVVGSISGILAGLLHGSAGLGLAVGLAVLATSTLAALLGFLVPYMLIKLGVDQVAGSAPIITSLKDIAGLLIYFSFAFLFVGGF
ncbi:MAG: magnesium transporter [Promicromonosporaceae bacterium]|nr:magnesium transporter [Promicromonosporaceae bacterium]